MNKNIMKNIKIIDIHAHLGFDHVYDCENTLEGVVEGMEENNISTSFLIPYTNFYEKDCIKNHDEIFKACNKYKGKFFGICCPNPHLEDDFIFKEIKRCINELNFIGIKLNPQAHAVNPLSHDGMKIFNIASELNVPVMVHTGSGIPFSLPAILITVVKKFENIKIVILHSGKYFADEAIIIAENFDNFYLETTWTPINVIKKFINKVGSNRILFGSDCIENISIELMKYKKLDLEPEELKNCLENTARKVFNLQRFY
jgi:uncharacterized protein